MAKTRRYGIAAAALAIAAAGLLWMRGDGRSERGSEPRGRTATEPAAGELERDTARGAKPSVEPSASWAAEIFELAQASDTRGYREGSGVYERPLDDSDAEMRSLMAQVYAQGGCAEPGRPCQPAADLLRMGGDRLARYLIRNFELSLEEGYPNRLTYLSLIAETRSEAGFRYVLDRVRRKDELVLQDWHYAARALSYTGHAGAVDEALRLLDAETDPDVLTSAVNTLWRVAEARDHLRRDSLERLLELERAGEPPRLRPLAKGALDRLAKNFEIPERVPLEQGADGSGDADPLVP